MALLLLWIINENVEQRQCQDFVNYFPEKTGYTSLRKLVTFVPLF